MRDPLDRGRSGAGSCRLNKQEAIGPWKHPFCASVWSMASLMNDLPPVVCSRCAPCHCHLPDLQSAICWWASRHASLICPWFLSIFRKKNIARKRLRSGHWRVLSVHFLFCFISHSKEWYFYQNLQSQPKITKPFERCKDFNICRTSVKKKHGARFSSQNQLGSPVKENIVSSFLQKLYVRTEETIPDE